MARVGAIEFGGISVAKLNLMAYDLGASVGRAMLGEFDGKKIEISELHRFLNEPVQLCRRFCWDIQREFFEMKAGLFKAQRAGLKIERMELGMVTDEQAKANYAEHEGKPFYDGLISYITSGPVVKMVVSGDGAVAKCRSLMGATNPAEAAPGTIRGDFGLIMDENVIHGSDSPEYAEREIGIFFA